MDLSTIRNSEGDTILHVVCRERTALPDRLKDFLKQLDVGRRREIQAEIKGKQPDAILTYFLSKGLRLEAKNNGGETPLDSALNNKVYSTLRSKQGIFSNNDYKWLSLIIRSGAPITKTAVAWIIESIKTSNLVNLRCSADVKAIELVKNWGQKDQLLIIEQALSLLDSRENEQPRVNVRRSRAISGEFHSMTVITLQCIQVICSIINTTEGEIGRTLFLYVSVLCKLYESDRKSHANLYTDDLNSGFHFIIDTVTQLCSNPSEQTVNYADEKKKETTLHLAAKYGLHDVVCIVLGHHKVNINSKDAKGMTPLNSAIQYMLQCHIWKDIMLPHYVNVMKLFVRHPDYNHEVEDIYGCTTLIHFIKLIGSVKPFYRDSEFYKTILENTRETIEVPVNEEYDVIMLLAHMNNYKLLEKVFKEKKTDLDIRATTSNNRTALHIAARYGNAECIKVLVENDPMLCNMKDNNGNTPLFYTVVNCSKLEVVNILNLEGWDCTIKNHAGEDALQYYRNNTKKDKESQNVISTLSKKMHTGGESIRQKFKQGKIVRDSGFTQSVYWPLDTEGKVKRLLNDLLVDMNILHNLFDDLCQKAGCSINIVYEDQTPIMWCISYELNKEIEKMYILHEGTLDCYFQDSFGNSALHKAATKASYKCTKAMLEIMKSPGSNISIPDKKGNTALFYICTMFPSEIVSEFLTYPWNFHHKNSVYQTVYQYYEQHIENMERKGVRRFTPPFDPGSKTLLEALRQYCTPLSGSESVRSGSFREDLSTPSPRIQETPRQPWTYVNQKHTEIVKSFTKEQHFFDYLIQAEMASREKVREWECKSDSEAAREILYYLPKRGPNSYGHFIGALKEGSMQHIIEIIEGCDQSQRSYSGAIVTPSPSSTPYLDRRQPGFPREEGLHIASHGQATLSVDISAARLSSQQSRTRQHQEPMEHYSSFPSDKSWTSTSSVVKDINLQGYYRSGVDHLSAIAEQISDTSEETMCKEFYSDLLLHTDQVDSSGPQDFQQQDTFTKL